MTCHEIVGLLGDYVDGDLPLERRCALDAHLAGCSECATYLATYRTTIALTKDALRDADGHVTADVQVRRKR